MDISREATAGKILISIKIIIFRFIAFGNFQRYLSIKKKLLTLAVILKFYEPQSISLLKLFVCKGDYVIDGGANLGAYTETLAKLVGVDGNVIAVEPLKLLIPQLLKVNKKYRQVKVVNKALSNEANTLVIRIPMIGKNLPEPALASLNELKDPKIEQIVETITLDSLSKDIPKISFVKLDLEGFELRALQSASELLRSHRPIIQFEENNMEFEIQNYLLICENYNYVVMSDIKTNHQINFYLIPSEKSTIFNQNLKRV